MVQQLHLLGRGGDLFAVDRELKGLHINDQLVKHQALFVLVRVFAAAAEDRLNPGKHLGHLKGLCDVVVGALAQTGDLVVQLALGGEHDDRGLGLGPDGAAHAPAVQHRQHNIQQHQIRLHTAEQLHALAAVGGDLHLIALLFQVEPEQIRNIMIILHNQNLRGHRSSLLVFNLLLL